LSIQRHRATFDIDVNYQTALYKSLSNGDQDSDKEPRLTLLSDKFIDSRLCGANQPQSLHDDYTKKVHKVQNLKKLDKNF